ncbi:MAG: hypothetical protein ACHQ50_12190, partial [Fimbriimonadales bacterium]
MIATGDEEFFLQPYWPDSFEREAANDACAALTEAHFEPSALLTVIERPALLAGAADVASGLNRVIQIRRAALMSAHRAVRRSAVDSFFAIRPGSSPEMGLAELMGQRVFQEDPSDFGSVDWQALSGMLDSEAP